MNPKASGLCTTALLATTLFGPTDLFAQWGGEVRLQMGLGGEAIQSVQYSDGSSSDLRLGTYFAVTLGPILEVVSFGSSAIELQGMLGWAGWSTGPENTEDRLSLVRFPLDATLMYAYEFSPRNAFRLGGGVSYHVVRRVGGSGSLEGTSVPVGNSVGPVAEAAIILGLLSAGVRYTHMEHSVGDVPQPLGGSSVGVFLSLTHIR